MFENGLDAAVVLHGVKGGNTMWQLGRFARLA